uniref:HDC13887 n=1 Tax=Drosophila melanogaster TaxID=7227 RepID=Q6IK07_DROME|nr:TPA_inf: HDC13887 [Drosophila melanogaster]
MTLAAASIAAEERKPAVTAATPKSPGASAIHRSRRTSPAAQSSFSRPHCRWAAARLRVASAAARPRLIGHSFIVSGAGLIASVQFVCAAAAGGGADSPQREVLAQQVGLWPDTCDRPFCLTESKGLCKLKNRRAGIQIHTKNLIARWGRQSWPRVNSKLRLRVAAKGSLRLKRLITLAHFQTSRHPDIQTCGLTGL